MLTWVSFPPEQAPSSLPGGLSSPLRGIHLVEHGCPVELALLPLFLFSLLNPHNGNEVPGKVSYAFLHNACGDHAMVAAAGERRILSPWGRCHGVVLQAGLTTAPALLSPHESELELMARIEAKAYYASVCVHLSARRECWGGGHGHFGSFMSKYPASGLVQ